MLKDGEVTSLSFRLHSVKMLSTLELKRLGVTVRNCLLKLMEKAVP